MPRATARKKKPATKPDFDATFAALKRILERQGPRLRVATDKPGYYCVESVAPTWKGKPLFFAAVRKGRNYVSFHLMPIYMDREMDKKVSAELECRRQGKACFNFTAPDPRLLRELAALTRAGRERWRKAKLL